MTEAAIDAMRERTLAECVAIADETWEETRAPEAAQIADAISALRASSPPQSPLNPSKLEEALATDNEDRHDSDWHLIELAAEEWLSHIQKGGCEMSTAYEELVERCRKAYDDVLWGIFEGEPTAKEAQTAATKAILAEVYRTLENVTPGMFQAAVDQMVPEHDVYTAWHAMRRASPLAPPR